ncbi:class I SAM-dependent methyltransferase [Parabacteroides goldsteinii]
MEVTTRLYSIVTGNDNLEFLYQLKKFPVFMGCTSESEEKDLFADMTWVIDKDSGMIQLRDLLPLEVVYSGYHSEALGSMWTRHHAAFGSFVKKYSKGDILEIGGGNGALALDYIKNSTQKWTIIEAQPLFSGNDKIKVITGFFDENFDSQKEGIMVDTIVHSHVMEHIIDPNTMLQAIRKILPVGGRHLFSIPNLEIWLRKNNNALHFEHTLFLSETMIDFLLTKNHFKILHKEYFDEHSIFYETEVSEDNIETLLVPNKYTEYKKIYLDMVSYYESEVTRLNHLINDCPGPVFLFGAHIFSQFLIYMGLNLDKIKAVLDNSGIKQGKRLYGTSLFVKSPLSIETLDEAYVILKAGEYQQEIKQQLISLNHNVTIWE